MYKCIITEWINFFKYEKSCHPYLISKGTRRKKFSGNYLREKIRIALKHCSNWIKKVGRLEKIAKKIPKILEKFHWKKSRFTKLRFKKWLNFLSKSHPIHLICGSDLINKRMECNLDGK